MRRPFSCRLPDSAARGRGGLLLADRCLAGPLLSSRSAARRGSDPLLESTQEPHELAPVRRRELSPAGIAPRLERAEPVARFPEQAGGSSAHIDPRLFHSLLELAQEPPHLLHVLPKRRGQLVLQLGEPARTPGPCGLLPRSLLLAGSHLVPLPSFTPGALARRALRQETRETPARPSASACPARGNGSPSAPVTPEAGGRQVLSAVPCRALGARRGPPPSLQKVRRIAAASPSSTSVQRSYASATAKLEPVRILAQ